MWHICLSVCLPVSQSVSPLVYLTEFLQKDRQTDSQAVIVTNQRPIEMLRKTKCFREIHVQQRIAQQTETETTKIRCGETLNKMSNQLSTHSPRSKCEYATSYYDYSCLYVAMCMQTYSITTNAMVKHTYRVARWQI